MGAEDGCATLVEGCIDTVLGHLDQYQDPVADAALGHDGEDEPEEDQKEAATFAETLESEGESSVAETLEMAEWPNEAFD